MWLQIRRRRRQRHGQRGGSGMGGGVVFGAVCSFVGSGGGEAVAGRSYAVAQYALWGCWRERKDEGDISDGCGNAGGRGQ